MMQFKEAVPVEPSPWERTDINHVWYNKVEGVYTFCDEAEQFNGSFSTKEAAKEQLDYYVKTYL